MLRFYHGKKIYRKVISDMKSEKNTSGAAIVCSHVASGKYPILIAERSEPDEPVDTGWQFVCNAGFEENVDSAQVWALDEVLESEPSLSQFMNLPPGTELHRLDLNSPWKVIKNK
jgi:hypothetical protein